MFNPLPVSQRVPELEGECVKLIPLILEHTEAYKALLSRERLDRLWYTSVPSANRVEEEIGRRLSLQNVGSMIAFSILDKASNSLCGMTTFMHIEPQHKRLEIGSTWLASFAQRTGINTEMKFLMLEHAFETRNCIAVEFRTHFMNNQSRRAIERLGAKLDGILRSHQILADGSLRDTCVYSITQNEWPCVRNHLNYLMATKYRNS